MAAQEQRRIRHYFRRYAKSFSAGIFFLILTQGLALSMPRVLQEATDALVGGRLAAARSGALLLFALAAAGAIARIFSRLFIFNSGRLVEYDMRNDLFAALLRLQPSFFAKMPSGQVMSRAINDLTQVRLLLGPGLLNLTNTALVYAVVVPILFIQDAELAFYCVLPLPFLGLGGRALGRRMYEYSRLSQDRLGELSGKVQENLGGIATVRAFGREEAEARIFEGMNDRLVDVNMKLAKLRGMMFPLMGLLGTTGIVFLLWLGGARMMSGQMTVGEFVEFNAYLGALTWPTIALGWMYSLWQRGLASMDRVNDIFGAKPTIVGGSKAPTAAKIGRIEIRDLTFRYGETGEIGSHGENGEDGENGEAGSNGANAAPALARVTTAFEPGELVVIVGRTGSGKSTLLKALARLIEIPRGAIFLDGIDVLDLPLEHVRGGIAYAPQDAFLFSRTLFENVAFGRPQASEQEVEQAVHRAGLDPDLSSFKDGLETVVGERGITLSGGQRQRAALARALLLEAPLLMLDDTLSAVDNETEVRILGELTKRSAEQTTLLVTHRLACAAAADRILVMEDGAIVEQGTEAELLALHGRYAEMHRRQRIRETLEAQVSQVPSGPSEPDREPEAVLALGGLS
ncbi:MAG: ABC transporter ATP-binding protein [Deltaproteobacteria bacterium]|nr:ABC transporter ATP-binding protein [Deltaproteobacteria bacterium]